MSFCGFQTYKNFVHTYSIRDQYRGQSSWGLPEGIQQQFDIEKYYEQNPDVIAKMNKEKEEYFEKKRQENEERSRKDSQLALKQLEYEYDLIAKQKKEI